jgi:hypothetical protein
MVNLDEFVSKLMDSVIDKANPFEFMDVTQEKLQIDLIEPCNKDMQHKTKEKKNILMCKMRIGDTMHEHSSTIYESCGLPCGHRGFQNASGKSENFTRY